MVTQSEKSVERDPSPAKDLEQVQEEIRGLKTQMKTLTNRVSVLEVGCREDKRRFLADLEDVLRRITHIG